MSELPIEEAERHSAEVADEDAADVAAARMALDEPGENIPGDAVWRELGLA